MNIDIIVATYNREGLLARLLSSVFRARVPDGVTARVIVADNNSNDGTKALVDRMRRDWTGRLDYVFEPRQGKSFALNTALAKTCADVVGFLDDDEEVDAEWLAVVAGAMQDEDVTFCSGPYRPSWGGDIPAWLPRDYPAIIGWVDAGQAVLEYGKNYSGIMMGGNAAIRTSAVKTLGGFNTSLGRTGTNLCGCEDADMSQRLMSSGARGLYLPDMIIYHYVPPERLTKRYYRRWCLHHAVTRARAETLRLHGVPYLFGAPRYIVGNAARAVPTLAGGALLGRWNTPTTFGAELAIWDFLGFLLGAMGRTPDQLARPALPSS